MTKQQINECLADFTDCCNALDVNPKDIKGASRRQMIVKPRQAIAYWLRVERKHLFYVIGHVMNRDHSTIYTSMDKVKDNAGNEYGCELIDLENYFRYDKAA